MKHGNIVIIDSGMGNLNSVKKKIESLHSNCEITSLPSVVEKADKIILPGVGHYGKAMDNLKKNNLHTVLNEAVTIKHKPILGICLGMQLMAKSSEEGNYKGFGWVDAEVVKFNITNNGNYKVPHIGWSRINNTKKSKLMEGIESESEFYFVHSYHLTCNNHSNILSTTEYGYPFVSAIEIDNIFGVQFHPEKSHDAGTLIFKNFLRI